MKNIEELCLELKNDFLFEIGDNKNWDIAEFPMEFYASGGGAGGLFILKKGGQETGRISHKKFTDFFSALLKMIDPTKINKGTLTIYPNGEYESSFIWDEVADLSRLIGSVENLFSFVHEELGFKIPNLLPNRVLLWEYLQQVVITMPFKKGQIQPLNLEIRYKDEIIHHSMLIQNVTYEESPNLITQFTNIYQLTNEGELKGKLAEKWNTIIFHIYADADIDFYKDVKFEWREENA